jgi:hypothetical protein
MIRLLTTALLAQSLLLSASPALSEVIKVRDLEHRASTG